jgi:Methyltransferase FkbM domain
MQNRLSAFLYGEKAPEREPVTIVDVGCSGGVGTEWDIFGGALHAIGFDPLEPEIERLRQTEKRPNISYEAAFVGLSAAQQKEREAHESGLSEKDNYSPNLTGRSSAVKAIEILSYDYEKEVYNSGVDKKYSSNRICLDEFAKQRSLIGIDFLKTDTDGYDLLVLIGAQNILESSVLAASIECNLQQPRSSFANVLSNVDRFMTSKGFYLFDIRTTTYTRAELPGPFQYNLFAQTVGGTPACADVLYVRDLASPEYEELFGFEATGERIIKTACLLEARGLADCAAELILRRADRLSYPPASMLDLLVPNHLGENLSYKEYMDRFAADPQVLFPSRLTPRNPALPFTSGLRRELPLENAISLCEWDATLSTAKRGFLPFTAKKGILVRTSHQNGAFAMTLALPRSNRPGVLVVDAEIVEGQVGISIVNAGYTELASETILSGNGGARVVMLPVSVAASGASLLIRNAWAEGRSRVVISRVELFTD